MLSFINFHERNKSKLFIDSGEMIKFAKVKTCITCDMEFGFVNMVSEHGRL